MWDSIRSPSTISFATQAGCLMLSMLLLLTVLMPFGAQAAGAWRIDGLAAADGPGAFNAAGCEMNAVAPAVEEAPEGETRFGGFMEAARRKKDVVAGAWGEVAPDKPVILITAGNAIGGTLDGWVDVAQEKGSTASDFIISTGTTAWTTLSESELAAVLGSTVHWTAYEDLMTEHPEL